MTDEGRYGKTLEELKSKIRHMRVKFRDKSGNKSIKKAGS